MAQGPHTDTSYLLERCKHKNYKGQVCGHIWVPKIIVDGKVVRPTRCPKCKCKYKASRNRYTILTCGLPKCRWSWVQRTPALPLKCPRCVHYYWQRTG